MIVAITPPGEEGDVDTELELEIISHLVYSSPPEIAGYTYSYRGNPYIDDIYPTTSILWWVAFTGISYGVTCP